MNLTRIGNVLLLFLFLTKFGFAQQTLKLSRTESEAIFIKENLLLIAEKLEIDQAEAKVIQAKLWPNPTLTIDQFNLWATKSQTGGQVVIPALGSVLGQNQQIGLEIEQLIITAGKRKKLIALEKVSVEKSKEYFEDLVRNLKVEFRNKLTELQYLQLVKSIYQNQLTSLQQVATGYKNQVEQGNFPKGEYIRIKALELEISKENVNISNEINEVQKDLKLLMRLAPTISIEITPEGYQKEINQINDFILTNLIEKARENRSDFKIAKLEESYQNKLLQYEKALKTPNITLSGAYDRGGNAMWDFIGFGISIDLPVFNRNQGNIAAAKTGIEQAKAKFENINLTVENEIDLAQKNLKSAVEFYHQIEPNYEATLDELLTNYTKYFRSRKISLLEYIDFLETYLGNKKIILEAIKNINKKSEELNYTVGSDIIK